jgi:uncharacterized membrane protein
MRDFLANLPVTFGRPWWLLAIPLILPPLIWFSARSLAGLGGVRRGLAILVRATVLTLIILALAETRAVLRNESLTTLFLIDASQSIPAEWRDPMFELVNRAIREQRRPEDLAGVIAFGREAKVEIPPTPAATQFNRLENTLDTEHTDIADAIKLALASFPEDSARRIVILSDGNANQGNAYEQALQAAELKVQIDVVPVEYRYDNEVLVEKIAVPSDVKQGDTVNLNVVVRATAPTHGGLQVYQEAAGYRTAVFDKPIEVDLERGINVRTLKQTITEPTFYRFTAEFVPDPDSGDQRGTNNRADAFVYARGKAHILLIEGTRGEHDELVQALKSKEVEVTTLAAPSIGPTGIEGGDPLPSDLSEIQQYDAVILGNVARDSLTDQQIQMLETNTHDMGAGLIMLGGPQSFGAGRWHKTPVEKALPVDMEIKDLKVQGKSALVMVMHASEIPEGNYWQKVIAQEAIKTLSPFDEAGLIHWQGQEAWLFTLQAIGERRTAMLRAIDRMTPGDMPDVDPSLIMGLKALRASNALTKHYIIISDGDPTPPTATVINQLIANKVTVTSVLVSAHGGDLIGPGWMQNIAKQTKGRFYNVQNPKALPRIYQKEVRLISRPLIFEREQPWNVLVNPPNAGAETIAGFTAESLPPISGLVLTSLKENALVEAPLHSPLPAGQFNPILAHWKYGLGRSVAFTSDAGRKWATAWPSWDGYAAFWWQVVRWALRPVDDRNLTLSLQREEGKIRVVIDALDKDEEFVNFLQFEGTAVTPEVVRVGGESQNRRVPVKLVQTAPGRYEGVIEGAEARGNYFVTLGYAGPDGKTGLISGGVSVPYSDEFRELKSNAAALESLATATEGGRVIPFKTRGDGRGVDIRRTLEGVDVFRRDPSMNVPRGFKDLWPSLLWWAMLVFLGDVAIRRIAPDVDRLRRNLGDLWTRMRGQPVEPRTEYMEKLRSRKAEVDEQLQRSRAATRFEAPATPPAPPPDEPFLTGGPSPKAEPPRPGPKETKPGIAPESKPAAPESYADRLMKAKKKVWEERDRKDEDKR